MGDIFVPETGHEPGEADLTETEVKRRAIALFGVNLAYIFVDSKAQPDKRFNIGRFIDDPATRNLPEIYRDWRKYGSGASWAEAVRRAELRARSGRKLPRLRYGRKRDLTTMRTVAE